MKFPKKIHQIWLQGIDKIPTKYLNNIKTIRFYNENWEYKVWDENIILKTLKINEEWLSVYNSFKYLHQKVDFAKYVILYLEGGIYIDMDVICIKPLDQLLYEYDNYQIILSKTKLTFIEKLIVNRINNGIIISKPQCDFLKFLLNEIKKNKDKNVLSFGSKMLLIDKTTGPYFITDMYKKYKNKHEIKLLNYKYIEPCTFGLCEITEDTYMIHYHELSWISSSVKTFLIYYINNRIIIYILLLLIIYIFIKLIEYLLNKF